MTAATAAPAVLVTGGAGYIGSHACKALAAAGYLPVVYDNLVHGHAWAVRWGPLEIGELHDAPRLAAVFARYRPVAVLHFAAYAYVGESVTDPCKYYHNNVGGSLALLQAMLQGGVDLLVFSSSCATYGNPQQPRLDEQHPQQPINPYGRSKLMVEQILRDAGQAYGLRSIALRYFNAAGADPDGEIGEAHAPETHLVPLALEAAAGGKGLTVFGTDYATADGSCVRDYIHVTDLASAHVRALQALQDGAASGAYNLGTGSGVSVREIIRGVEAVTGCTVPWTAGARRPGDPAALVADPRLFCASFGWQPVFSALPSMLATAWAWRQQRQG